MSSFLPSSTNIFLSDVKVDGLLKPSLTGQSLVFPQKPAKNISQLSEIAEKNVILMHQIGNLIFYLVKLSQ